MSTFAVKMFSFACNSLYIATCIRNLYTPPRTSEEEKKRLLSSIFSCHSSMSLTHVICQYRKCGGCKMMTSSEERLNESYITLGGLMCLYLAAISFSRSLICKTHEKKIIKINWNLMKMNYNCARSAHHNYIAITVKRKKTNLKLMIIKEHHSTKRIFPFSQTQ